MGTWHVANSYARFVKAGLAPVCPPGEELADDVLRKLVDEVAEQRMRARRPHLYPLGSDACPCWLRSLAAAMQVDAAVGPKPSRSWQDEYASLMVAASRAFDPPDAFFPDLYEPSGALSLSKTLEQNVNDVAACTQAGWSADDAEEAATATVALADDAVYDVFVSHCKRLDASEDRAVWVADVCEGAGLKVFFDRSDLTDISAEVLERSVKQSRVLVTVLDPYTFESVWCVRENRWAAAAGARGRTWRPAPQRRPLQALLLLRSQ